MRKVFETYKAAVLAQDGTAAVNLASDETIAYYQRVLDLSLDGSEVQTRALGFFDRLMVVMVRHRVEPDKIRSMNGASLFSLGIEKGWTSPESVAGLTLVRVRVVNDEAWGDIATEGEDGVAEKIFRFKNTPNGWKIDLLRLLKMVEPAMKTQVSQTGMTEDEFIVYVAGMDTVEPVTDSVWAPLGR